MNGVQDIMLAMEGNLADDMDKNRKADIVVANIIADIIIILAKDVKNFLKEGGIFILIYFLKLFFGCILEGETREIVEVL